MKTLDVVFKNILTYDEFCNTVEGVISREHTFVSFHYSDDIVVTEAMINIYKVFAERLDLCCDCYDKHLVIRRSDRDNLKYYYEQKFLPSNQRNRMGCSESWYDCYYAITQTLTEEEVKHLDDDTIELLVRCVSAVQEALY